MDEYGFCSHLGGIIVLEDILYLNFSSGNPLFCLFGVINLLHWGVACCDTIVIVFLKTRQILFSGEEKKFHVVGFAMRVQSWF